MRILNARALVCVAALLGVGGCNLLEEIDWRKGEESVDACIDRLTKGKTLMGSEAADDDLWVPSYTFDVTRIVPEELRELVQITSGEKGGTGTVAMGDESYVEAQREEFRRQPARREGALFMAEDPALYKILGEPGLEHDLLRQGCAMQKPGMRLINWRFTKAEYFEEGQPEGLDIPPEVKEKLKAL